MMVSTLLGWFMVFILVCCSHYHVGDVDGFSLSTAVPCYYDAARQIRSSLTTTTATKKTPAIDNNQRHHSATTTTALSASLLDEVLSSSPSLPASLTEDRIDVEILGQSIAADVPVGVVGAVVAALLVAVVSLLVPPGKLIDDTTLRAILQDTYLGRQQQQQPRRGGTGANARNGISCVYKASRDGWGAIDFHRAVDERGSGVVVAKSLSGKVFGGFNPVGWRSTDDYYQSTAAFLWYKRGGGVTKMPTIPGGDAAVFDYATGGPCFGSCDLQIGPPRAAIMGGFAGPDMEDMNLSAGDLRQGKAAVGFSYDYVNDKDRWPIPGDFRLVDLEVYCQT